MSRRTNFRRSVTRELAPNELRETADRETLKCGHVVEGQPLATRPNGRALYMCPEGCGLKERKR